ncbi:MAG: cytochrome c3 family protein [Ignavibacteriaceae bacterium]
MKKINLLVRIKLVLILLFFPAELSSQRYTGSDKCLACHLSEYNDWKMSGHPYKIQKINDNLPPSYPQGLKTTKRRYSGKNFEIEPGVPQAPKNYTWETIGWVLGGYFSNARFLDTEGYIILGDSAQYNIVTKKQVSYIQSVPGKREYDYSCFRCHTTGPEREKGTEFEPYPGIKGSWAEAGIGCEACHGAGSIHSGDSSIKLTKEGFETCNKCHARDRTETNNRVEWVSAFYKGTETGFIRHREQGDMMAASKHGKSGMTCVACHNPHKSLLYELGGIKEEALCQNCHSEQKVKWHKEDEASCKDCHMPSAAKNAEHFSVYVSEKRAHFWKIITEDLTMFANLDTTFSPKIKYIKTDTNGNSGLTLDYTCLQCHEEKDTKWASQSAGRIHGEQNR